MADRAVYEAGYVECLEGTRIHVIVMGGLVRIRGEGAMDAPQREAFAQLFVRACWLAGRADELVPP
jgi:hypothetical protein